MALKDGLSSKLFRPGVAKSNIGRRFLTGVLGGLRGMSSSSNESSQILKCDWVNKPVGADLEAPPKRPGVKRGWGKEMLDWEALRFARFPEGLESLGIEGEEKKGSESSASA